jgi:hypothetical protein
MEEMKFSKFWWRNLKRRENPGEDDVKNYLGERR